jgi:hypothetical protein
VREFRRRVVEAGLNGLDAQGRLVIGVNVAVDRDGVRSCDGRAGQDGHENGHAPEPSHGITSGPGWACASSDGPPTFPDTRLGYHNLLGGESWDGG